MIQLGLIGYPVSHSLSPKIHAAALQACGLEGNYSLFPVQPEDKKGLQDLLSRLCSGDIQGLNVTIPHKQNVIPFLDELTPTAEAIGAVNTIHLHKNKIIGDNSDAAGFLADLKKFLTTEAQRHGARNALVLGAGGSARAVIFALVNDGWKVTIAARRIEQAGQLADSFKNYCEASLSDQLRITDLTLSTIDYSDMTLIVNTTPIGMTPHIDQSPLPKHLLLPRHVSIYDLVYNPRETKLVRDARAQELEATTGLGMLIEQAALSFEIWTGCNPSRELLFDAVKP